LWGSFKVAIENQSQLPQPQDLQLLLGNQEKEGRRKDEVLFVQKHTNNIPPTLFSL
jgi:hypothetical protein